MWQRVSGDSLCVIGHLLGAEKHMIFGCLAVGALRVHAHLLSDGIQDVQHLMWQDAWVGVVRVAAGLPSSGW